MTNANQSLLDTVVLPVASESDARATCAAAAARIAAADGRAVVVHVIEKAGGAPDKASVEQRKEYAAEVFAAAHEGFADATVPVETRLAFGTDVAETIFEVADEEGATAIAFTPREGSRWVKLLTGNVAMSLVSDAELPVIVLPENDENKEET